MMKNIGYVIFAMNTSSQFIFMKDITTMDSQNVFIVHAMNVTNICLVHLG
jgi:hypothetical protein